METIGRKRIHGFCKEEAGGCPGVQRYLGTRTGWVIPRRICLYFFKETTGGEFRVYRASIRLL